MVEKFRATYVFFISFYPEFTSYVTNISNMYKGDVDLRTYLVFLKNHECVLYYFN